MIAAQTLPGPSLRRAVLAALLLFVQVVSPSLALGMMRAAGPAVALCRADGTASLPDPAPHPGSCAACPACQAPLPILASVPALPARPVLHLGQSASPSVTPAPPQALGLDARPRGPPSA